MEPKNELYRNAIADARRKELETYQRALDIQWLNNRMEDGRMGRCLALIQREAEMEKNFQERTDHAAIVNDRAEKETALGIEVAKVRREEACELLRRHYLREQDPSLKELTKKLQAGYVCRDLRQQILNKEYRRLQEKAADRHANSVLVNALYNDQEVKEHEDKEKMERNMQYCKELQQQLVNRQRQKQCQYEDTLIEKKMLEDIMRTIADEDQRELSQKREQTEKMRKEMETFKQARDAWKEKQKNLVLVEERRVEDQKLADAERDAAVIAARQRKLEAKEAINKRMSDQLLASEAAKAERENVIKMLQEQEVLEKYVQDDLVERDHSLTFKRDIKQALFEQMDSHRRELQETREKETIFRMETEAKLAAEEKKEQEKERKKKDKGREYSAQLLQQIQDNARRRNKEQMLENGRAQYVWDCHKAWDTEVSAERAKIIEEHAPHLIGHLQPGVIKNQDLPALKRGAVTHPDLSGLHVDAIMSSEQPKRFPRCNAQCRILRLY